MANKDIALGIFTVINITVCGFILLVNSNVKYSPTVEALPAPVQQCPAGSYDIGIEKDGSVICKLEPTGCPYGDSIPLDSPKCAPPAPEAYDPYVPTPEYVEPVELMQGK
jgi:hypothetical protein